MDDFVLSNLRNSVDNNNSTNTQEFIFNSANFHAWVSLGCFAFTIFFVITAPKIPIPKFSVIYTIIYHICVPKNKGVVSKSKRSSMQNASHDEPSTSHNEHDERPSRPSLDAHSRSTTIIGLHNDTNIKLHHDVNSLSLLTPTPSVTSPEHASSPTPHGEAEEEDGEAKDMHDIELNDSQPPEQNQEHVAADNLLLQQEEENQKVEFQKAMKESKFYWVPFDLGIAPIVAIFALFVTQSIDLSTFAAGIIGNEQIKPYSVLALFMSLAYVCISLDQTGIFEFIAKQIIRISKGNGHKLYISFCVFASVLTLFTSNDIVILTLTPIICYMSIYSQNMDPIPYVVSQYFLANIWSISLQIGNPTNIIVAEAIKLNFLNYSKWMAMPAVAAGLTCQALLYLIFYRSIPKQIFPKRASREQHQQENNNEEALQQDPAAAPEVVVEQQANENYGKEEQPEEEDDIFQEVEQGKIKRKISKFDLEALEEQQRKREQEEQEEDKPKLRQKWMAIIKTLLLFTCLVSLAASSLIVIGNFTISSWMVTVAFFLVYLVMDLLQDIISLIKYLRDKKQNRILLDEDGTNPQAEPSSQREKQEPKYQSLIWNVVLRMPWKVVPFALGMFIMVEVLKHYGFISLFAKYLSLAINQAAGIATGVDPSSMSVPQQLRSVSAAVYIMSYLSSLSCNLLNNQPMTILFTDILQDKFYQSGTPRMQLGVQFSLIAGSNLGANITLIGALAGIMWAGILKQFNDPKINKMGFFRFLFYGLLITPVVIFVCATVIVAEIMVFPN